MSEETREQLREARDGMIAEFERARGGQDALGRWCSNRWSRVSHLATLWRLGHDPGMKSRVHPKYKTKYRVTNWAEYDRALVRRGDITLWISEDAIEGWKPASSGNRGGQKKFSDHAIETSLVLRLVFKLPLRQAEGFLRSILSLMDLNLEAPDHTTISSSTALVYRSSARASGPQLNMEAAESALGRNSISVSIALAQLSPRFQPTGTMTTRTPPSTSSPGWRRPLRASRRTQPMTQPQSTKPPEHATRKSSFHRERPRSDRGDQALAIERSDE